MADDYGSIFAEGESITRRKKLLEAMQLQNANAPIVGQNTLSSVIQALAKFAGPGIASSKMGDLEKAGAENQNKYGAALQGQLGDFMNKYQGTPATTGASPETPNFMGPQAPAMPGDPKAAIMQAMASRFPEMKGLGAAGMAGIMKENVPEKFGAPIPGMWKGKPAMLAHGDKGTVRPVEDAAPEAKPPTVIDKQAVDFVTDPSKPRVIGNYAQQFTDPYTTQGPSGPMLVKRNIATNEVEPVDKTPKTNLHVGGANIMMAGQKAGMEKWAETAVKVTSELGEQARSSVDLVGKLNQLERLTNAGTFSGPSSGGAIWLGQLSNAAGIKFDQSKLTNSQSFDAVAKEATQKLVSTYGGNKGITASEAEQIARVTPQLATSPQARAQLSTILRNAAQRSVENYKTANTQLGIALKTQDPSKFEFGPTMLPNAQPVAPIDGAPAGNGNGGWSVVR
jgi:hypothetical protein